LCRTDVSPAAARLRQAASSNATRSAPVGCPPEILGDLFDRHAGLTVTGDPHDIVAELLMVGLGHSNILPARRHGKPSQMSFPRLSGHLG